MSRTEAADWAQLVGIPLALVALFAAWIALRSAKQQLKHADRVAQGQFLLAMDQVLQHYEDLRTHAAYDDEWDFADELPTDFEALHKRARVRYYLAVFERLGEFVERDMIPVDLVSDLYGSRLEFLLRKPGVRGIVTDRPKAWRRLVSLWDELRKQDERETLEVLWQEAIAAAPAFREHVRSSVHNPSGGLPAPEPASTYRVDVTLGRRRS